MYEGYAPYGVAVLVETATDNINRTVANVRSYFTKYGGALGKTGSLDFIFTAGIDLLLHHYSLF